MAAGCGGGGGGGEALFPFSADTLDVEAYASRYKGRTRLVRLLFIAERCGVEETELQALRMAHDEAMECGDALLYRDAALRINGRLGPRYVYEDAWIDSFDRLASEAREPAATWTCTDCSDSVHASSSSAAPARATTTGSGDAGGGGGADLLAAIRGIGTHASSSSAALARATTTSSGAAGGGDGADLLAAIPGIGTHASSSSAAPAGATTTSSGAAGGGGEADLIAAIRRIGTHATLSNQDESRRREDLLGAAAQKGAAAVDDDEDRNEEKGIEMADKYLRCIFCMKLPERPIPYQTTEPLDTITISKLQAAAGLAFIKMENYRSAANKFLEIAPELGSSYSEVIAPQDVSVYGALCALASFDRSELKSKVIDNMNFCNFLEQVPVIRELVNDFYSRHYASCMKQLEELQPTLRLDIHLHDHLETLYKKICHKALKDMKKINATRKMASARLAYLDLAGLDDDIPVPEHLVYAAHLDGRPKLAITGLLAYLANRFDDAVETLLIIAESGVDISPNEFEFYHEVYAAVLESKLQMIRTLENNCDEESIISYLKKVRMELEQTCTDGVRIIKERLLPAAINQETLICCHNLTALLFYYLFTCKSDIEEKNEALRLYLEAKDAAAKLAPPFEGSAKPLSLYSSEPNQGRKMTSFELSSSSDSEAELAPEVWAVDLRKPRS